EDDAKMAAAICSCLSGSGFQTEPCFDGTEGLQLALSGQFDAITLDRMLPGCDGLKIARAVRESGLETPILMLGELAHFDDRLVGLRGRGDDYLIKPFGPDELAVRIEVLLRRNKQPQPHLLLPPSGSALRTACSRPAHRLGSPPTNPTS